MKRARHLDSSRFPPILASAEREVERQRTCYNERSAPTRIPEVEIWWRSVLEEKFDDVEGGA